MNDCLKSGRHHILDPCIDNEKWLEVKILRARNDKNLKTGAKAVSDVPPIPKTGWKAFPSQDLPLLFNCGHVYHYALESLLTLPEEQNCDQEEEDKEITRGLGHMTYKPFLMDANTQTRDLRVT